MSERDGAAGEKREASREGGFFARLAGLRPFLIGVLVLVGVFWLAGELRLVAAIILSLGIVALMGVIPTSRGDRPARLNRRQIPGVWPETGIKQMADALPDPCIVLDRRGVVRYANTHAETAFRIRPGDPLTLRLRAPELVTAFDRVAQGGATEKVEYVERVPTERWYEAWFAALPGDESGRFVVLYFHDLTDRRRSERVRVDFVANASHELRTPLASLTGFIETLQGPARDDAAARERFLAIMLEQAMRMRRLIDDLLSLSRIEMKLHMRPCDRIELSDLLRHVVDTLEPLARDEGVVIETKLPEIPLNVLGDRDELIEVFSNLVENACKYGQPGGRAIVEAHLSDDGRTVSASIRDFGPGIPPEHLPRLTERFYRVDAAASRAIRGTGLGLAISKHILNRHRARLKIESRLGEGALFTTEFDAADGGENPS